jgi:hypothetical protein
VEEMIGKARICLAKQIIDQNLQEEIKVSLMNPTLNRAKVTLMMNGG